jgi:2',3'-cyclic-nucleotide 2'-phosphodiesterase (5'-nucleotidase family)
MASWAARPRRDVVKAIRAERGDDKVLFLDGGDTWQGSYTSLQDQRQDMVDVHERAQARMR